MKLKKLEPSCKLALMPCACRVWVEGGRAHNESTEVVNQLWLVNQPKCGTGSLEAAFEEHMGCHNVDVHDKTKFYKCLGNYKMLYRTHYADVASEQKIQADAQFKAAGVHTESCMVITAVRNPLLSIPSRFFETNLQNDYCAGTQSVEEVLGAYEKYLRYSFEPANQVSTTASMLRAFGATDIRQAMECLADHGYAFFDEADADGPWGGCQLLLLQIDYAEDNSNIDKALQHVHEGAHMNSAFTRSEQCPDAAENIAAITNYPIDDSTIDVMAKTNPEIRDVIQYYRDHPTTPVSVSSK